MFSESFFVDGSYQRSESRVVHLSDALRVLLVWRLGGLYLDTDYVVINDMSQYRNSLVNNGHDSLTNCAFSFSPRYKMHSSVNLIQATVPPVVLLLLTY